MRKKQIEQALANYFESDFMEVKDESYMHHVPEGAESHFNITLVSQDFEGVSKINRHREVYNALGSIMSAVHAVAIHAYTPFERSRSQPPASPKCLGGSKK